MKGMIIVRNVKIKIKLVMLIMKNQIIPNLYW